MLASGLGCVLLAFVIGRPRLWLPNEVAGVVVFLIGVALVVLGARQVGMQLKAAAAAPAAAGRCPMRPRSPSSSPACRRGWRRAQPPRAAPFTVLVGAVLDVALSLALGRFAPNAAEVIAARPWLALPDPYLPSL